jgi:EmrB/QacA subfamily drug resistance transporter
MLTTTRSVRFNRLQQNSWLSLGIILFAPFIIVIDIFIVNVSLPTIKSFFHSSNAYVQLVVAAYLIGYTVFLITGSRVGDHFGRKKIYWIGLLLFTIASVLCGTAKTIEQLVIYRFLQGMAAAFTAPQTYTLIHIYFPDSKRRDQAFGYYGIASGAAAILGQLLGGLFISLIEIESGWRLIFLINLPLGVIASVMAILFLKESKERIEQRFDIRGVIILTVGLIALVYPITRGRELGWPFWSILLLLFAFLILYYFIQNQKKKSALKQLPLLDMALFSFKSFNLGILGVIFFFGVHTGFLLNCAIYLQEACGFSPVESSYFFTAFGVGFVFSANWSIKNLSRYGLSLLQFGCFLMMLSMFGQMFLFKPIPSTIGIYFLLLLYGIGNGLVLPSILNISLRSIKPSLAGNASGIYSTVQQLASALGVSIIGGVFLSLISYETKEYYLAYNTSLVIMLIYIIILICIIQKLKQFQRKVTGNE